MTSYDLVRGLLKEASQPFGINSVNRLVGNLRVAGIPDTLDPKSERVARRILSEAISRQQKKLRTADAGSTNSATVVQSSNTDDHFIEIDALISEGKCPRCKTHMVDVKLGGYNPDTRAYERGMYCKACRTTLPMNWGK